ncbi:MAG: hypothetical protein GXP27_19890 [Planctomycetes bacterium]|nr:hypothetical protein [Planctomycetota bacterium]
MQPCRIGLVLGFVLLSGSNWGQSAEPPARPNGVLKAGAAKVDITPRKWPQPMVGSFSERLATKAWDPLYVRAMVLDDGRTALAIAIVDSCYVPRHVLDDAKQRIAKAITLRPDHMLMAATHTHTAPASRNRRQIKADPGYVEQLTQGLVDAVVQAYKNREPAEVGWGVTQVPEEVFNRRWFMKPGGIVPNPFGKTDDKVRMNPPAGSPLLDRPAGPVDPDVSVLSVRTRDGRPIALLANYSLHYVGGIPRGGVSADYFGEFARLIEERLGGDRPAGSPSMVAMMSNGTSGDVNNISFRKRRPRAEPFERMRTVARRVADAAIQVYQSIEHRPNVSLAMAQKLLTIDKRRPTPEQIEWAKRLLAGEEPKRHRWAEAYARWVLDLAKSSPTEELVLQAIRIGDLGICAIPCEVFVGLEIKQRSPLKPTFTIELANGHYGYLPTPRQHELGGYETWLGSCILEEHASEKIVATLIDLLDQTTAAHCSR